MKKQIEKTPEEIARDLENIDFAEIEAEDLRDILGGTERQPDLNGNCCC